MGASWTETGPMRDHKGQAVLDTLRQLRKEYPDIWESFVGKRVNHLKTKYAGVAGVAIIVCNVLSFLLS